MGTTERSTEKGLTTGNGRVLDELPTFDEPRPLPDNIGKWQPLARKIAAPLFRMLFKVTVEGLENIPASGPAVLCPNHLSVIDSFVLPAVLPRGIMYVGKAEYLDDWKTAKLFPAMGMIPIDRRGGDHATAALDTARSVLSGGGLFGIYPEGTRSRSGNLHKGHTGAARLAIETGAPIIPVGLLGTLDIQPPDQAMPNFFTEATVKIGAPIQSSRYADRVGDRSVYRELIDEVMFEIQALTGQTYDPTYAGAKPSTPTPDGERSAVVAEATIGRRSSAEVLKPRPLVGVS